MFAMIDTSLLIAAAASFVAGLVGYIIVRLWIVPIWRYRTARRHLDQVLSAYLGNATESSGHPSEASQPRQEKERLQQARQFAMALVDGYTGQVPVWYRLLLDSRGESPSTALDLLSNLSKINNLQQRCQRIRNARGAMGLK